MKERVYGEKINIDTENTISFYNQRAKTVKNREQEYTTVLLGDQDPEMGRIRKRICTAQVNAESE